MDTIPDFELGLGHIVYALAKVDGYIQEAELALAKDLLSDQLQGELALYAFLLLEECDTPVEEAYDFALRRFVSSRKDLDESRKKEYVAILLRIAGAYDGISRKEREIIQRFRRDLRRL